MHRRDGFTLIEVLVAAFVAALVFGVLVSWMAQNLRALGAARAEQHALLLGEQRARDFDLELRQSGLVEPGVERGEFPEPDSDLGWEIQIEPWRLALPADYDLEASPSPLFEPVGRQLEREDPPLHRVTVRVFRLQDPDADLIEPFVLFGVVPAESPQAAGGAAGGLGGIDPATGEPLPGGPSDPSATPSQKGKFRERDRDPRDDRFRGPPRPGGRRR